jgi:hypothetical protein
MCIHEYYEKEEDEDLLMPGETEFWETRTHDEWVHVFNVRECMSVCAQLPAFSGNRGCYSLLEERVNHT